MTPPKTKKQKYEDLVDDLAIPAEEMQMLLDGSWPAWSTGSVVVDILTGIGGIPQGRITEVFGKPQVGKSNILLSTAGQVQKAGKKVVMMDFEGTFDPRWARTLGADPADRSSFLYMAPDMIQTVEQGFDRLYQLLDHPDSEEIGLIIWDSLAGATTGAIADKKSVEDTARLASRASILSEELPNLARKMRKTGGITSVGFVNQVRANMGFGHGPDVITPGGFAFEHAASMRLGLKHRGFESRTFKNEFTGKSEQEKIAQRVTFSMEKTKHGQRGRQAEAIFTFNNGFDNVWSLVEFGVSRGDIKKKKLTLEIPEELTADGKGFSGTEVNVRNYFHSHPESYELFRDFMVNSITNDYKEKVESYSFGMATETELVEPAVEEVSDEKLVDLTALED